VLYSSSCCLACCLWLHPLYLPRGTHGRLCELLLSLAATASMVASLPCNKQEMEVAALCAFLWCSAVALLSVKTDSHSIFSCSTLGHGLLTCYGK